MVSLPKDSVDTQRPSSQLLPTSSYSDDKSQPRPTTPAPRSTNPRARLRDRWAALTRAKRFVVAFLVAIIGIHVVVAVVRAGQAAFFGCRRGHYDGHGGPSDWTDEEPLITTATYTDQVALDDGFGSQVAPARFTVDLAQPLTVRFADGSDGTFTIVSHPVGGHDAVDDDDDSTAYFAIESAYTPEDGEEDEHVVGPQVEIATTSYSTDIGIRAWPSHEVVLNIPPGVSNPSIHVQGEGIDFILDDSARDIHFDVLDVKTSSGDIVLADKPLSAQVATLTSETGDITGEYNVSRLLELRTVTGSIDVEVALVKPHFPGNHSWPPHHHHPPPHHKHGKHHHKHHHKHGKHGKHGKKGSAEKRSFAKRWFGLGADEDSDEVAAAVSGWWSSSDVIDPSQDGQPTEYPVDGDWSEGGDVEEGHGRLPPPPRPPHGPPHGPMPPHEPPHRPPHGPPHGPPPPSPPPPPHGPPHLPPHGPPHGPPGGPHRGHPPHHHPHGPPPIIVHASSITGSIKVKYVSHPANVSLVSKAFSKTGSVAVTLAEEFQGKYKLGTKVGTVVVANPFEKRAIIEKEIKGAHGAFVEGFVVKKSANLTGPADSVDIKASSWFDVAHDSDEGGPLGPHGPRPPFPRGPGGQGHRGHRGHPPPPGFGIALTFTEVGNVTLSL